MTDNAELVRRLRAESEFLYQQCRDLMLEAAEALSAQAQQPVVSKVVCHAPGERCLGCDHYKGLLSECVYASPPPAPQQGPTEEELMEAKRQVTYPELQTSARIATLFARAVLRWKGGK